jgi:ABC-type branched-subunit amino acid transport system substrate-binding protein
MALTGGIAANGRAALIAMKLWEEDINASGGLLGRPVKLIYYDDQSTPPNVPALYTKLLDVDKVDIVFSGYGTNMTVPAMPVVWLPTPTTMYPGIQDLLQRYQARAAKEGVDQLGCYLPPFAYSYLQVVGDAIKATGTLDQEKLTAYINGHPFKMIVGDVRFGDDGDWTEAKIVFEQFHDVKGNDVDQFRDGKSETILDPPAMRTGGLIEPYADIVH